MNKRYKQGAIWRKWDLHIHTPASIVQGYGGDTAWDEFFERIRNLPDEVKVVGINDYYFIDGYERVMQEHEKGGFPNIEKFFPILEFRIDTFTSAGDSKFNKINLHILFDLEDGNYKKDIEKIKDEFISQIHVSKFHATKSLSKDNLTSLASDKKLKTGFSELIPHTDEVLDLVNNAEWCDKTITFLGYTEWNNLDKGKQVKLYKDNLYSSVDAFLTASEEDGIAKKQEVLQIFGDKPIIQSLDIHDFDRFDKYKCLTWIKADPTFKGFRQALLEPTNRICIGSSPDSLRYQREHPEQYISFVEFISTTTGDGWFDDIGPIPINPGLVAIIGDKGNGKSALADSIGLAGGYSSPKDFSFLCNTKFLKSSKHKKYEVRLTFLDGNSFARKFSDARTANPHTTRVKYLSQSFVNRLCDEVDEGRELQDEIDRVIFSHVPKDQRLGVATLSELILAKSGHLNKQSRDLRSSIANTNREIVRLESVTDPDHRQAIVDQLGERKQQLKTHNGNKPKKPTGSATNKTAIRLLEKHSKIAASIEQAVGNTEEWIGQSVREVHNLKIHLTSIDELKASADQINAQLKTDPVLKKHGVEASGVLAVTVDRTACDTAINDEQSEQNERRQFIEKAGGVVQRIESRLENIRASQSAENQKYTDYAVARREWEKQKDEIIGSAGKPKSIKGLETELEKIDTEYPVLLDEQNALRKEHVKELLKCVFAKEREIRDIFSYVQRRADQFSERLEIPSSEFIEFLQEFRISEKFPRQFFEFIARNKSGTFLGDAESSAQLEALLPESSEFDELLAFPERVHAALTHNIAADPDRADEAQARLIGAQLRVGKKKRDLYDFLYKLDYLDPRFAITYQRKSISMLSPGERGILLLAFYLLIDNSKLPIVIDQPEENVGNETITKRLVSFVNTAKQNRQIIVVTHSANLAIVCDAEQILYARLDQTNQNNVVYTSGSIEYDPIKGKSIDILEGTKPAFDNRKAKWEI